MLFAGKPKVYERLGFRALGEFSEVTDQLASRIVMKRDLTERTRGDNPQPLFSRECIRKLIRQSSLKLHVEPDAEKWLQDRASTLGMGGVGKALFSLYLAAKVAYAQGEKTITVDHFEGVGELTMGHENKNSRVLEGGVPLTGQVAVRLPASMTVDSDLRSAETALGDNCSKGTSPARSLARCPAVTCEGFT